MEEIRIGHYITVKILKKLKIKLDITRIYELIRDR